MLSLCFPDMLSHGAKSIAECISHEAGHALGLRHDGKSAGSESQRVLRYSGHGSGETGWAPIMGVGYSKNLVQWSKGEYSDANNHEDDLAIIASQLPYRPDDFGDTITSAAQLLLQEGTFLTNGIIGRTDEKDVFSIHVGIRILTVQIEFPNSPSPNLDAHMELLNSKGTVLATSNPSGRLACSLSYAIDRSDVYYLRVSGSGKGTSYTSYSSLGHYSLSGNIKCPHHSDTWITDVTGNCTCNKGYSGPDGEACVGCPAGTFKNVTGSSKCSHCPEGTYSEHPAQSSPETCKVCSAPLPSDRSVELVLLCACVRV